MQEARGRRSSGVTVELEVSPHATLCQGQAGKDAPRRAAYFKGRWSRTSCVGRYKYTYQAKFLVVELSAVLKCTKLTLGSTQVLRGNSTSIG